MRISDWSSDVCSSDLTYWNRGAEELYGWTKAAVAGRTATDLLQTQFPLSRAAAMETLMQTDRWEGVLVHARRDGPPATVASRWSLERNERGQPIRSEEHTSELQSLMRISYAVFCLKKKINREQ